MSDYQDTAREAWEEDLDIVALIGPTEADVLLHEVVFGSPEKARQHLRADLDKAWDAEWQARRSEWAEWDFVRDREAA